MRLEKLTLKGLGPFRAAASVDLEALDAKLVAVCGGNGAGKSTLLETFPGALYRQTPTRGTLADLATERAAYVEAVVVNGARYTIRHVVDGETGKGESFVRDAAGAQVLADGKLRSFDAWAKRALPAPEVLYASTFAAQGSGGFLEMKPAERKGVLLRVLGIDRLEQLAQAARERARGKMGEASTLAARAGDARRRADIAAAEQALEHLRGLAADAEQALERARLDLADAKAAAEARERCTALTGQLDAVLRRLGDVRARLANNRKVLAERDAIEAAVAHAAELRAQVGRVEADRARILSDQRAAQAAVDAAARAASGIETRLLAAQRRQAAADARCADAGRIADAEAAIPALRARVAELTVRHDEAHARVEERRSVSLLSAGGRIAGLRGGLEAIRAGATEGLPPGEYAGDTLLHDDQEVTRASEAPRLLADAQAELAKVWRALERARGELTSAQTTAARAGEMAAARQESATAEAEALQLESELAPAREALAEAQRANQVALAVKDPDADALLAELASLRPLVDKAAPLAGAAARIAELEPQLVDAEAQETALAAELAALPELRAVASVRDCELAAARADDAARRGQAAVAVAASTLESAREAATEATRLDTELRAAEELSADWTRLGDDLGRDGLQAMEIDAAAPELTELANDLLRTCVGSRWAVSIETTKLSSDGKKLLEGCEVRVIDSERGRDAAAESLSGGERVLVSEAIALALAMLAMRRAGIEGATIVRDESGAALDPVNGRGYVAMLRRAAEIVGARQVLFVSHNPELAELADARLVVCDGAISVEMSA